MKTKLFLLFSIVLVLFTGCDNSGVKVGYVTGKLTIDGKPAPENMEVHFQPQFEGGSPSQGFTDANGNFKMEFSLTRDGVEVGPNKVVIVGGGRVVPAPVLKANNKLLWEQTFEVKKGRQKFDFNIDTSVKVEKEATPARRGGKKPNTDEVSDSDIPNEG
ncbi:MAG: hypothetical protein LBU65_10055 [Planctomycetaceae bacterium]|jgi:hypothetical protein|nr:hypothetical protein [Planctomycetaceae bacterium]